MRKITERDIIMFTYIKNFILAIVANVTNYCRRAWSLIKPLSEDNARWCKENGLKVNKGTSAFFDEMCFEGDLVDTLKFSELVRKHYVLNINKEEIDFMCRKVFGGTAKESISGLVDFEGGTGNLESIDLKLSNLSRPQMLMLFIAILSKSSGDIKDLDTYYHTLEELAFSNPSVPRPTYTSDKINSTDKRYPVLTISLLRPVNFLTSLGARVTEDTVTALLSLPAHALCLINTVNIDMNLSSHPNIKKSLYLDILGDEYGVFFDDASELNKFVLSDEIKDASRLGEIPYELLFSYTKRLAG